MWSRWHSGSARPLDSGREKRCWVGSQAAGRSCDVYGCTCIHGDASGCKEVPALVSENKGGTVYKMRLCAVCLTYKLKTL